MRKISILLFFAIVLAQTNIDAQTDFPTKGEAEKHFAQFLHPTDDNSYLELLLSHQPTLKDCKAFFTDDYYIEAFKIMNMLFGDETLIEDIQNGRFKGYNYVKAYLYQTNNIADEGNGRMAKLADKIRPNITYYKVKFVKEQSDTSGLSFLLFTYLNGRWVWFPFN